MEESSLWANSGIKVRWGRRERRTERRAERRAGGRRAGQVLSTAVHLAWSEIWRNKGRFLLFSMVVALITVLVLFIAALGTGLLGGIREYFQQVNADLLVYQDTARLEAGASRLEPSTRAAIRRVEGVRAAAPIGFSSATIVDPLGAALLDVSLIGVEPGGPGEPAVVSGKGLSRKTAYEVIVDRNVARFLDLEPGDTLILNTIQDNDDEYHSVQVTGVSDSLKYSLSASVFVPLGAWDEIRPQARVNSGAETPTYNVVAVQAEDPDQIALLQQRLQAQVSRIEVVDRIAAYESLAGYSSIRSSLDTQRFFVLLIGTLVIGGFFQIQTLQKVPQIGTLKAIGTPNVVVALTAVVQILTVILSGIIIGALVSYGLSTLLPPNIPIVFELETGAIALGSILVLGLLGGVVSVRYALRVEPLIALGLG